ncbi:ATP-binding protein [Ramlibacter algicola]|uniref:ATP-binding protein n=1 Tax=Ramlibacter algicola TaxID=2795217 RepID=A0A934Q155_9BURK|nr:ATP-binding protein [Ramlibacter algicola]MBK0392352.1 ATP-binding protein [Ramlibacter algicola]
MQEAELRVPSTLEAVAQATQQLRALLPDWLSGSEADAIELAIAEALTNVVQHGYAGQPGHEIRLRVRERDAAVEIDLWDQGRPIPRERLRNADANTTFQFDPTDLAGLPEGGMGLALIKSAFHEVRYGSRDGTNRLHLVRRL